MRKSSVNMRKTQPRLISANKWTKRWEPFRAAFQVKVEDKVECCEQFGLSCFHRDIKKEVHSFQRLKAENVAFARKRTFYTSKHKALGKRKVNRS